MILFSNPSKQLDSYRVQINKAIKKVLSGKQFINGAEVSKIEKNFSSFNKSKFTIGVANGTDALEISLRALNIGQGDEVITTTHTAVATVSAITSVGAKPVLADINESTFTINVNNLKELKTSRTKAVIAVHIYGNAAEIVEIQLFCKKNNLKLIEDVSQAHGGKLNGIRLGNFGNVACYSCYPTKNLGALGDAGLVTTNDKKLAKKIRMLREYGWDKRYISKFSGRNSRLDEIQASILNIKIKYLDKDNKKRVKIASVYDKELKDLNIVTPYKNLNIDHVYHLYVIRTKQRDKLRKFLLTKKIVTGIHYPVPIHLQPAYKNKVSTAKNMSISENAAKEILSLPIFPELKIKDVLYICKMIRKFYNS